MTSLQYTLNNTIAPASGLRRIAIYVGNKANVTAATGELYSTFSANANSGSTLFITYLLRSKLEALGFASGSNAYTVVHGLPSISPSYTDPVTGRTELSGLGQASPVVSFVVP